MKKIFKAFPNIILYGAEKRNRTPNLLITIQLLYQLSYFSILVALIGFEPMNAGVRVQSLTTWPQGNIGGDEEERPPVQDSSH